jgi:hypothetical protein
MEKATKSGKKLPKVSTAAQMWTKVEGRQVANLTTPVCQLDER